MARLLAQKALARDHQAKVHIQVTPTLQAAHQATTMNLQDLDRVVTLVLFHDEQAVHLS